MARAMAFSLSSVVVVQMARCVEVDDDVLRLARQFHCIRRISSSHSYQVRVADLLFGRLLFGGLWRIAAEIRHRVLSTP
jgi:hypothetical protein